MSIFSEGLIGFLRKPNSIGFICQLFEAGLRQRINSQLGNKALDDYLIAMCKQLKLSVGYSVAVGFCLSQSQFRIIAIEAIRLLKSKLPDLLTSGSIGDIPDDHLYGLIQLIHNVEVEKFNPEAYLIVFAGVASP